MVEKKYPRLDKAPGFRTAFEKNKGRIFATQSVCALCGLPVDYSIKYPDPMSATVDHIIPLTKGGHPSDIENLQLAHRICNRKKSDKLLGIKEMFLEEEKVVSNSDLPLHMDWTSYKWG